MTGTPGPVNLKALIEQDLAQLEGAHRLRRRQVVTAISATRVRVEGHGELVNFASNNYLGLTHHPRIVDAAATAVRNYGAGSGAAGLITGYSELHGKAERAIAGWKGTEDAVLLPSGYQANHAAVGALAALGRQGGRTRFLVDKLAHASLIDAVRATDRAEMRVFGHNEFVKLKRLLAGAPPAQLQVVLTESIFSMDGDAVNLEGLVTLKREHPFVLLLDEAHGSGVYGANGAGYAQERGLNAHVDVSVLTLSKALGGVGGAVCASSGFCASVVNHGRAYMYSTSVPPGVCAACVAAIDVMLEEPARQARVRELGRRVRDAVRRMGLGVPAGDSPIVPVILGEEETALRASRELFARGLLVPAVRPPTVARGASRLRVTLSSEHGDDDVDRLLEGLGRLR